MGIRRILPDQLPLRDVRPLLRSREFGTIRGMPAGIFTRAEAYARRIQNFLARDVWTAAPKHPLARMGVHLTRMGILIFEGFTSANLLTLAAALTYQVTFALIPLLALGLSIFQGFSGVQADAVRMQQWLSANLPVLGEEVIGQLVNAIQNINAPTMGILGFATLLFVCFTTLTTIERAFNRIWGIRRPRPLLRRFTIYWTMLTLGPLFLTFSLTITSSLQNHRIMQAITENLPILHWVMNGLFPYVIAWTMFCAIYLFMPNTTVRLGPALVGAVIAGSLWELCKSFYVWYNTSFLIHSPVYGSFGTIPVFLLWVWLSWVIVLLGAEIAFAAQHVRTYRREVEAPRASHAFKEKLGLHIVLQVVQRFVRGEPAPSVNVLTEQLGAPSRLVNEVAFTLTTNGVLAEAGAKEREPGLLPAMDPALLTIGRVIQALRNDGGEPCALPNGAVHGLLHRAVAGPAAGAETSFRELALRAREESAGGT